jgi:hypothetical protein
LFFTLHPSASETPRYVGGADATPMLGAGGSDETPVKLPRTAGQSSWSETPSMIGRLGSMTPGLSSSSSSSLNFLLLFSTLTFHNS